MNLVAGLLGHGRVIGQLQPRRRAMGGQKQGVVKSLRRLDRAQRRTVGRAGHGALAVDHFDRVRDGEAGDGRAKIPGGGAGAPD